MLRTELSRDEAMRHLVGAIRNHASGTPTIFSPYYGCDLIIRDGQLCRASGASSTWQYAKLAMMEDVLAMTDEEIYFLVEGAN